MSIKSYFNDKLSEFLFLEVKKERLNEIFGAKIDKDISIPIKSSYIIEKTKALESLDQIPIALFIQGMFYIMAIDEDFKYNHQYKELLVSMPKTIDYIKGAIFQEVKNQSYEDAYIMLRGLIEIEPKIENYDKAFMVIENLREKNNAFKDEELNIIDKAKSIERYALPYLYEAIISEENGNYEKALFSINNYIEKGGEETPDVIELLRMVKNNRNYEQGKELIEESPKDALKLLLPLLEDDNDNAILYYHIAVAYRILENYEKAIYYLNEALEIDSALAEVVNELGINHAAIGDYDKAILYLRRAFEATKSIEICTNLVLCYYNIGDLEQAKNHLEIAKMIDSKDEIVNQLENLLKGIK